MSWYISIHIKNIKLCVYFNNSKQGVFPKWSVTLSADTVSTKSCQQMKSLQLYLLAHIFSCSTSSHTFLLLLIIITSLNHLSLGHSLGPVPYTCNSRALLSIVFIFHPSNTFTPLTSNLFRIVSFLFLFSFPCNASQNLHTYRLYIPFSYE
jgi:hypothetical protein